MTVPNTLLNLCKRVNNKSFQNKSKDGIEFFQIDEESFDSKSFDKVSYYSGDWGQLPSLLLAADINNKQQENSEEIPGKKFDFILSSETIYNPENYEKLLNIFSSCLKPGGIVYPLLLLFLIF